MCAVLELPVEGQIPSLGGATGWLNSPPVMADSLRGKVVAVDFWTYTCVNWLRTLPYLREWAHKYEDRGLVVLGVHTPEFGFEHEIDNVRAAAEELGVDYPIALDSDYAVWRAFGNHYWPALYLVDAVGQIRHHQFGEGEYERSELAIQALLTEAGEGDVTDELVSIQPGGVERAADWATLGSPETYLGYLRAENFASPGGAVFDAQRSYTAPDRLEANEWALAGDWTLRPEEAVLDAADGRIVLRFHARDVNAVMAPTVPGSTVRFRALLDDESPGEAGGLDVDERGGGVVGEPRLYQLIRQPETATDHTLEITFLDAGVGAYVFTFG